MIPKAGNAGTEYIYYGSFSIILNTHVANNLELCPIYSLTPIKK